MPATYEKIATTTISGTSTTTVTLSGISSSYTDLVLVLRGGCDNSSMRMQFNSDTGSNYSVTILAGTNTLYTSRQSSQDAILIAGAYGTQTATSNTITQIQNYSNTTTYKTVLSRNNEGSGSTEAFVGTWRNTAAVTSISLTAINGIGTWFNGSTINLYGILKAA